MENWLREHDNRKVRWPLKVVNVIEARSGHGVGWVLADGDEKWLGGIECE